MITLPNPITQSVTEFEVISFWEDRRMRRVEATIRTNLGQRQLVLWNGDELATAGQYTDADIEARVIALLSQA